MAAYERRAIFHCRCIAGGIAGGGAGGGGISRGRWRVRQPDGIADHVLRNNSC